MDYTYGLLRVHLASRRKVLAHVSVATEPLIHYHRSDLTQAVRCVAMFQRIKAVWHDPVWSKVIAAGVLAAIAAAWAFRADLADAFRSTLKEAGGWLAATLGWLEASASTPRWLLLLILLAVVLLVRIARQHGKAIGYCTRVLNHHVMVRHVPQLPEPPPEVKPTDAAAPAPDVAHDPDSMEGYFSDVRALSGRFAEREEYLRRRKGKAVRWRGTVRSVRTYADNSVAVHLLGESGPLALTSVEFPATFRERALALLPGDSVLIMGRFTKGDENMVQIDGDEFELVRRAAV